VQKRTFILTILILVRQLSFGQTYSSLTTDKEIYDFLNWMTITEKKYEEEPFLKRKNIYYEMSTWDTANFVRTDTINNPYSEFERKYLFKKRGGSDTIFNTADRKYLLQQYFAIKDTIWHNRFKNSKLTKNKNQVRPNRYYYSVPLFSVDKNHVVVSKIYYCGSLCAYFGYYIYRKIDKDNWEFVTCINCGMS
jgi:hypothetical protein